MGEHRGVSYCRCPTSGSIRIGMQFQVGQLVWIVSPSEEGQRYEPPALVVAVYEDMPRVFVHNEEENKRWFEAGDTEIGWVYDIVYRGQVEEAVSAEWLRPWDPSESLPPTKDD